MNPKWTVVFAALLVVAGAIYFLGGGPGDVVELKEIRILKPKITAKRLTRIEIEPAGRPKVVLERSRTEWRLQEPIECPADPETVRSLAWTLDRFKKETGVKPGPNTAPSITGLDKPVLVVTFSSGEIRNVVRFGKSPATNTSSVFYQVDGDEMVYLIGKDTIATFNTSIADLRSKRLVDFQPSRAVGIDLEYRFHRAVGPGRLPEVEIQKAVIERLDTDDERGWYLMQPWKEYVDPNKILTLLGALAQLEVDAFRPFDKAADRGFEPPQSLVRITLRGTEEPVEFRFGDVDKESGKRWVRIEGAAEDALMKTTAFDALPVQRDDFRRDQIFQASPYTLQTLRVEAPGEGAVVLERQETRRGRDQPVVVTWNLVEPKGLKVKEDRIVHFVKNVLIQRVVAFLGPQPQQDWYDSPDVIVTATNTKGKERRYLFRGGPVSAYVKKEWLDELYEVAPSLVDLFWRLEMNFLHEQVFDVPRQDLRGFEFRTRETEGAKRQSYVMRRDPAEGAWEFVGEPNRPVDGEWHGDVLTIMNYIRARRWVSQDPADVEEYGLTAEKAAATLVIHHEGGPEEGVVFYVSKNLGQAVDNKHKYYALRKGDRHVFEITPMFIQNLQARPHWPR